MSGDNEARAETLDRLRHWHRVTGNPLYAWEAIALCLHRDDPPAVPDWCVPCLREAAGAIFDLTRRRDLSGKQATASVAAALGLVSQGKKNAFARMADDRAAMKDANTILWKMGSNPLSRVADQRNISRDRAGRIVSHGKRLHRVPTKSR
jgi:hypothetical protein